MDLMTVLDIGNSMSNAELHMLKRAMRLVIFSLGAANWLAVVVQLGNLKLQRCVCVAAWRRRVFQNGLEQRAHVAALVVFITLFISTANAFTTTCMMPR